VKGKWAYLYCAIDSDGLLVDAYFRVWGIRLSKTIGGIKQRYYSTVGLKAFATAADFCRAS
jgi:hypothetical protein